MKIEIADSFKKGDPVPEWLFYVVPTNKDSVPAVFVFEIDCHVIQVTAGYVIIPDSTFNGHALLKLADGNHLAIGAASENIFIPVSFHIFNKKP